MKDNLQIFIQYTNCNAKVMSIVVAKRHLSVLLKIGYRIHLFLCRMLWYLLRLQCCLQNSSAAKGTDRCALVSNGVKKVVPKRYSKLLAEMQRSYDQGKGGIVGFGC